MEKKGCVKQMIEHMEDVAFYEKADAVRFTVTLTERDSRRLEYLARRYGMKRAEMARELLTAAMGDAEEALGLHIVNEHGGGGTSVVSRYAMYIMGQTSLDEFIGQAQKQEGDE